MACGIAYEMHKKLMNYEANHFQSIQRNKFFFSENAGDTILIKKYTKNNIYRRVFTHNEFENQTKTW